jgi:hypothetical protein
MACLFPADKAAAKLAKSGAFDIDRNIGLPGLLLDLPAGKHIAGLFEVALNFIEKSVEI